MAGGRTSYLAIRVVGDSLGAQKSLASVDRWLNVVEESTRQTDNQMKQLAATQTAVASSGKAVAASNAAIAKSASVASVAIEDLDDAISDLDFYSGTSGGGGAKGKKGKGAKTAAAGMMGFAAAAAAAAVVSVKAFSDVQEAAGAVQAIFGESIPVAKEATIANEQLGKSVELVGTDAATSAEQMLIFAEDMNQYGVSTAVAAQASAILGAQLKNAGIPAEHLASVTQQLIKLGADMAVTFGYTVPQALVALAAALRGEFEPLEKFGFSLNAATVQAEALRLASEGVTFETERQAKVVATLSLIQQQSTDIQKKAEEEYMNVSMTVSRLMAETKDLAATLGAMLAPAVSITTDSMSKLIDRLTEAIVQSGFMEAANKLVEATFQGISDVLGPILIPLLERVEVILGRLADFMNTYITPAIEAVAAAFTKISEAIAKVIDKINDLIAKIDELWTRPLEETAAMAEDINSMSVNATAPGGPSRASRGPQGTASSANTIVYVQAGIGDPHAIAKEIRKVLRRDEQRIGRVA